MSLLVNLKQKEEKLFVDDLPVWNQQLATCLVQIGPSNLNHLKSTFRLLKKKRYLRAGSSEGQRYKDL